MIDAASIREIIKVYEKHGWSLRRVLLSDRLRASLDTALLFGDVSIRSSDIDAAWFSRETRNKDTAWEIRHLSSAPYALVVVVKDGSAEFEDALFELEEQLRNATSQRMTGH